MQLETKTGYMQKNKNKIYSIVRTSASNRQKGIDKMNTLITFKVLQI